MNLILSKNKYKVNSYFADFIQTKKSVAYFADFEQVKKSWLFC